MKRDTVSRAIVIVSALLMLPGCMIGRLYAMRAQMCETENSIQVSALNGVRVSFLEPVILDSDIKWLSGVSPHSEVVAGDLLTMQYIVSNADSSGADNFSVPVEFEFRKIDGEYKLAQFDVVSDLPFEFNAERMDRMTAAACEKQLNPLSREITLDLTPDDMADLPERSDVLTLVGTPNRASNDGTKLHYVFSVAGLEDETGLALVDLEYDESGTRLLSATSSYAGFKFSADFETGTARTQFSM